MDPASGKHGIGSDTGQLRIKTSRTGLGRKAGHDLTIEVTRWSGDVTVDVADPGRSSVVASIEVDSLEVREGAGGLKPLTDDDRADIKRTIREKILHTAEHPRITFTSTETAGTPHAFTVTGDLTIMGTTHPITLEAGLDAEGVCMAPPPSYRAPGASSRTRPSPAPSDSRTRSASSSTSPL